MFHLRGSCESDDRFEFYLRKRLEPAPVAGGAPTAMVCDEEPNALAMIAAKYASASEEGEEGEVEDDGEGGDGRRRRGLGDGRRRTRGK